MPAQSTEEKIYEYRVSQFMDLGFHKGEAKRLADSKGPEGYPLDIHRVRACLRNGCTHVQAYRIFRDE